MQIPEPRPPRARTTDSDTSHAAARSVKQLRASQEAVLAVFQDHPEGLTDPEVALSYDRLKYYRPDAFPRQSDSGLRTRRAELVARGFLRDSGRRKKLRTGRKAIVWQLNPERGGTP